MRLKNLTLFTALSCACAWAQAADSSIHIQLQAQNQSGEHGTAVLTADGDKTRVVVRLQGGPAGVAQPDHIHMGTCAKLDPKPAYGLKPVVNGVSESVIDVPLQQLQSSPMAINVHASVADIKHYVACGDIR